MSEYPKNISSHSNEINILDDLFEMLSSEEGNTVQELVNYLTSEQKLHPDYIKSADTDNL